MPVLRCPQQPADDPVVQVDDLVGDGGHPLDGHREQRRVPAAGFELCQIGAGHRRALTSKLQQPVPVNKPRGRPRQIQCAPRSETLDMLQHRTRVRTGRCLPQPTDLCKSAIRTPVQ